MKRTSIKYLKFKRTLYSHGKKTEKFVAKIHYENQIPFSKLSRRVMDFCTMTDNEVFLAVGEIERQLEYYLGLGCPVDCGKLGKFFPAIRAKSVDTEKECNNASIKKFDIIWKPSKELKSFCKEVKFDPLY